MSHNLRYTNKNIYNKQNTIYIHTYVKLKKKPIENKYLRKTLLFNDKKHCENLICGTDYISLCEYYSNTNLKHFYISHNNIILKHYG